MKDPTDPMSAFTSHRTAKIVRADAPKDKEWDEQLRFCKWLKHEYPDILFRSDIQSAGKLSPQMQNIKQIIDPYSGWPDVTIYECLVRNMEILSVGLCIEMKKVGASLSGDHFKSQKAMHDKLKAMNWTVEIAFGAEHAKEIFLKYIRY